MRWGDVSELNCSIARTLSVVGDRWTLLVLREAFSGTRRFDAFRAHLGLARNVLAARLDRLADAGVFERVRYQDRPARYEYRLTERGRDLYPVLVGLMAWGDRWLAGDAGVPVRLVHAGCGRPASPTLTCGACGDALSPANVRALAGPGLLRAQKPS